MDRSGSEVVFAVLCIATNLIIGSALKGSVPAAVVLMLTSIVTTLVFQVFAYLDLGYLDPFFAIAGVVSAFWALPLGAATLWLMGAFKRVK